MSAAKIIRDLAAGAMGSLLMLPVAGAQQQVGGTPTATQQGQGTTQGSGTPTSGATNTGSQTTAASTGGGTSGTTSQGTLSSSAPSGTPYGGSSGPTQFGMSGAGGGTSAAGRGARGTIGGRSSTGSLGTGGLRTGSSGGAGRSGMSGTQSNRQNALRAQYVTRLDFPPVPQQESQLSTLEVRTAVEQSLTAVVPTGISAVIDGSTVILQGTVATAADSKLAERMVLLEPGVRSVKNQLVVQGRSGGGQ